MVNKSLSELKKILKQIQCREAEDLIFSMHTTAPSAQINSNEFKKKTYQPDMAMNKNQAISNRGAHS